jgi:hypothetical protein
MSKQIENETVSDMVLRTTKVEVYQRLLKAQQNFLPIIGTGAGAFKDRTTGEYYLFATKDDIKKSISKPLANEGLLLFFTQAENQVNPQMVKFKLRIVHADSGQFLEEFYQLPVVAGLKNEHQGTVWDYGSAQTYAFRYCLEEYLNLVIYDSLAEIEGDGVSLWLNQSFQILKQKIDECKSIKDVEKVKEEKPIKKYTEYIKEYGHREYVDLTAKLINSKTATFNKVKEVVNE